MINNRQGGGRRRGRGGQRGQSVGGQPGNRQDNRQRGNAAQLLEKYKSMARDAQLAGDRVQTEYYLQYAEHYFRILGENRPRFDDQRRALDDEDGDGEDEMEAGEAESGDGSSEGEERPERAERFARPRPRDRDRDREPRPRRASSTDAEGAEDQRQQPERVNGGGQTIAFDVLPPAIGRDEEDEEAPEAEARPRRRTRAPRRPDSDDEIAPAA